MRTFYSHAPLGFKRLKQHADEAKEELRSIRGTRQHADNEAHRP
jgi:hypothetical protein